MKKVNYMSEDEIAMWILKHNPGEVYLYYLYYDTTLTPVIKPVVAIDSLDLPEGCYYNSKNRITNKGNTLTGMYSTLRVDY